MVNSGKTLAQGAEAIIQIVDGNIHKSRASKSYRHPVIDTQLRQQRSKTEYRVLTKLQSSGFVPKVLDLADNDTTIIMEHLKGEKLRDILNTENCKHFATLVGKYLGDIHDKNITHGDLTTSNMIAIEQKLFLIDFGLAQHSKKVEDKAVDIHVMKQALQAHHSNLLDQFYEAFCSSYGNQSVLERVLTVEKRGKNKAKF